MMHTGAFVVPMEGIWSFAFTAGDVGFPAGSYAYIRLRVDGTIVAQSYTGPNNDGGMVKKMGHSFLKSHVVFFQIQLMVLEGWSNRWDSLSGQSRTAARG